MAIFNSYVSLPEGMFQGFLQCLFQCSTQPPEPQPELSEEPPKLDGFVNFNERFVGPKQNGHVKATIVYCI
jgi:hypothetical protein